MMRNLNDFLATLDLGEFVESSSITTKMHRRVVSKLSTLSNIPGGRWLKLDDEGKRKLYDFTTIEAIRILIETMRRTVKEFDALPEGTDLAKLQVEAKAKWEESWALDQ